MKGGDEVVNGVKGGREMREAGWWGGVMPGEVRAACEGVGG